MGRHFYLTKAVITNYNVICWFFKICNLVLFMILLRLPVLRRWSSYDKRNRSMWCLIPETCKNRQYFLIPLLYFIYFLILELALWIGCCGTCHGFDSRTAQFCVIHKKKFRFCVYLYEWIWMFLNTSMM